MKSTFVEVFTRYGIDIKLAMAAMEESLGHQKQADEVAARERKRKAAKLRFPTATLENADLSQKKNLKPAMVKRLAKGEWLTDFAHLIFIGPTGTMKTTLACAFANALIDRDFRILFYRFENLIGDLQIADDKEDRKCIDRLLRKLDKFNVLVIDDWGLFPVKASQRRLLFNLVERREDKGSLIITSQYPPEKWHEVFGEPTSADAVLDRIVHRANLFDFSGEESMRKLQAKNNRGVYVKH
jgi:DNA replication protein DnaC